MDLAPEVRDFCGAVMSMTTGWILDHPSLWMKVIKRSQERFGKSAIYFQKQLEFNVGRGLPTLKEYLRLAQAPNMPDDVEKLICEFMFEWPPPKS